MSIILFVAMGEYVHSLNLPHKTKKNCASSSGLDRGECAVWDGVQCRIGHIDGKDCVAKGEFGPVLMALLGVVFFITFIILGVTGFMKGHHKQRQYARVPGL